MRLFVAIELPDRARTAVDDLISRKRATLPKAHWVSGDNLHLTLAFLGEVAELLLRRLGGALTEASARVSPFTLQLEGSGCFPANGKARVAWIGLSANPELVRLQGTVSAALQAAIGFEPEQRSFSPHLTVGRCAPPWPTSAARSWAQAVVGKLGEAFPVSSIALIQSRLSPAGASYTTLHRVALRGAA
jgi:2'-5' RNA ligase